MRARALVVMLLAGVGLLLAGCGNSIGTASSSGAAAGPADPAHVAGPRPVGAVAAACNQLAPVAPTRGTRDSGARSAALRIMPRVAALEHLFLSPIGLRIRAATSLRDRLTRLEQLIVQTQRRPTRASANALAGAEAAFTVDTRHDRIPQCGLSSS